jgi:hypothetical protein
MRRLIDPGGWSGCRCIYHPSPPFWVATRQDRSSPQPHHLSTVHPKFERLATFQEAAGK